MSTVPSDCILTSFLMGVANMSTVPSDSILTSACNVGGSLSRTGLACTASFLPRSYPHYALISIRSWETTSSGQC